MINGVWIVPRDWKPVAGDVGSASITASQAVFCEKCGGIISGVTWLGTAYPCRCKENAYTINIAPISIEQSQLERIEKLLEQILERLSK